MGRRKKNNQSKPSTVRADRKTKPPAAEAEKEKPSMQRADTPGDYYDTVPAKNVDRVVFSTTNDYDSVFGKVTEKNSDKVPYARVERA